jgi:pilus assembly protein CpaC
MLKKMLYVYRICIFCAAILLISSTSMLAAPLLEVGINDTRYLNAGAAITRVVVGNPAVADVKPISESELMVFGYGEGSTSLIVWTENGMRQEFEVSVSKIDANLAKAIEKAINLPDVHVSKLGSKILLQGTVTNQYEKSTAQRIAELYCGGNWSDQSGGSYGDFDKFDNGGSLGEIKPEAKGDIENLLQMTDPSQIDIEAQIIEISSDDAKKIGLQYSSVASKTKDTDTGFVTVTQNDAGTFYGGEDYAGSHNTSNWLLNHISSIDASIRLLVTNGKAKVLSRPSITTLSGETAKINIGGQIPLPITGTNGQVTVEYKDYGIRLEIRPTVDLNNNITSKVYAEVSSLDWSNAVTTNSFKMPGMKSRKAGAVINVPSGMTMVIGGLMNSEEGKNITKVPLLGDIPILGEFFKYSEKTQDKKELIILITPRIVNETTPANMSDKMKEAYEEGKKDAAGMHKVDLNHEDAAAAPGDKKAVEEKDTSILGKYLNRDVLKKPAE